jgi:hypothetical protein
MLRYYKFVIPNPPEAGEVRYGFASRVFCAMNPSYGSIEERSLAALGMTVVVSIEEPV